MPRIRMVDGELVEEPLHHETVRATPLEDRADLAVALPGDGWSTDPGRRARRQRGIDGAANALRNELIRNHNPDPGIEPCRERVADAVAETSRRRR